ncbi:hypothetical protein [Roseobacter sp. CCS2]|uniref:hypothetical protein n=1 Tax=Roseobacter sp. CCS2 TaxID=391593 RepID=UPI0000F3E3F4|nr:hypothetical protein [Roseobacter sp. CCS2]EBA12045.1 hypothetical protein RCCS2_12149 [Roseobacter sp. CCS2]
MSRIFFALTAAAFVGIAAPASALSLQVNFPTLTYPPQPTPDVSQGCSEVTKLSGYTCTPTTK